jgi:4-hydroxybenzoate polyprenyltransferase
VLWGGIIALMSGVFSRRLFPILQLTRMALVFTAISNSLCTLLIWTHFKNPDVPVLSALDWKLVGAVLLISTGLYGFGMSLNDIIDRRRDSQLAAHRPLPSGRVGVAAAHVVTALLLTLAIIAALAYARWSAQGWFSFILVIWTAALIALYDVAAKYLVALGLLSLGLIRFFHAVIPAPQLPVLWHPLLLLNHVTVLSLIAYRWEQKRPPLTPIHWTLVPGGLAIADALLIALVGWRRFPRSGSLAQALSIEPGLIAPAIAAMVFIGIGFWIRLRSTNRRDAGQRLMLFGLLWLIVYDGCFAWGYVDWRAAAVLLPLLPLAYASVQVMRWWGGVIALSQRPSFKRAEA